ncbi:MAG TPA: ROK family protein [Pirellulaceae bacterium]|nr:ROK family protein [Pirellulaceae bacterium]
MDPSSITQRPSLYLGIDVGGTNTKLGLVTETGQVVVADSFPTHAQHSPTEWLARLRHHVTTLLSRTHVARESVVAAGLGTPGSMDIPRGMILEPPNLPGWRRFPIKDAVANELELPVTFANDANAAAYGEFWVGGARDYSSLLFLTLGTGIGGGIIIDSLLVAGAHSLGGEIGHLTIDWTPEARRCGCGQLGHLEAYASATGLVARAQECLADYPDSMLGQADFQPLSARKIGTAAAAGDRFATRLVDDTADYLARGIALAVHLIDPQAVLLGGAMTFGGHESVIGRAFLARVAAVVNQWVFPPIAANLIIDYATLGSDAGLIGAAGLARLEFAKP